jgi:hypothetical protein
MAMPLFFFDLLENGQPVPDEDGTQVIDIEQARVEALRTLGNIAKNELTKSGQDDLQVSVRDENGQVVLTVSLLVERRA